MRRRRGRPPVLAELPESRGERTRPGALSRSELEIFGGLLGELWDSPTVLATGDEAKSALALGLATAAAVEGRRAALVECDLSGPSLAARLGLDPAPGLHEYLRLEVEAPRILQSLVLAGPASGRAAVPLACVVAGKPAPDGSALLASEGFAHAIAKLRNAYDLLVLDGPPLLDEPSLLAVAAHADRTIACGARSGIPKRLGIPLDGLVIQA